jgi:5-methyltetrahydropteroyltriglutamate--homocysteine methyltransferase
MDGGAVGSYRNKNGSHAYDIPLADYIDLLFEAANVRHEHEAQLWESVRLPEGRILAPGCVTHSMRLVGKENVIASTDCGLGLRCHPQIAWAKLQALGEGARRASRALWRQ